MSDSRPVDLDRAEPSLDFLERLGELRIEGRIGSDHETPLHEPMWKGEIWPTDDDQGKAGEEDASAEQDHNDPT